MTDYIYGLRCPLSGEIRYIGKTNQPRQRLSLHVWWARQRNHTYVARWIGGLLKLGLRPSLEVIFEVPPHEGWQYHEMRLIEAFRSAGHHLMNLTVGGDGVIYLSEARAQAAKLARRLGYTEASRAKMAESMRRYWADPANHERHTEANRTALANDPVRLNRLKQGVPRGPEGEAKRLAAVQAYYADPENMEIVRDRARQKMIGGFARTMIAKRWGGTVDDGRQRTLPLD